MRTNDFATLWRSSIGFDRLFDLINDTQRLDSQDDYPPYDVIRGEGTYHISLALAGFSPDETVQQNKLTITGRKADHEQMKPNQEYPYQGISARPIEHEFNLEDQVEA